MKSSLTLTILICSVAIFGILLASCGEKEAEAKTVKCEECGKVMQKDKMISFEVEGVKLQACSEECKKVLEEEDHTGHNH